MTRDEIAQMARKTGFTIHTDDSIYMEMLHSFAALVAASEREACAQVCETTVWSKDVKWWMEATKTQVSAEAGQQCAAAIRARGQS